MLIEPQGNFGNPLTAMAPPLRATSRRG